MWIVTHCCHWLALLRHCYDLNCKSDIAVTWKVTQTSLWRKSLLSTVNDVNEVKPGLLRHFCDEKYYSDIALTWLTGYSLLWLKWMVTQTLLWLIWMAFRLTLLWLEWLLKHCSVTCYSLPWRKWLLRHCHVNDYPDGFVTWMATQTLLLREWLPRWCCHVNGWPHGVVTWMVTQIVLSRKWLRVRFNGSPHNTSQRYSRRFFGALLRWNSLSTD